MSLQSQAVYLVPEETARVARAAFPNGKNLSMRMRDQLGAIFDDQQCATLFSPTGAASCSSPHGSARSSHRSARH